MSDHNEETKMTTPSAWELEWKASVRRGLESGDPAYRRLLASMVTSFAAVHAVHRAQERAENTAIATPTWTASDDPLVPSFCGVARHDAKKGDTLTVNLWEQPEPTVAEKWAEHIGNRAANLEWMAQAVGTQVSEHEWCTARTQLRAMRDEIDKALAEIEPLAVEQGGRDDA